MPAIVHLQPRFMEDAGSGEISATAIGLIVGIGLVPSILVIWVVCFLFFAYPKDRNFCCMKRKKRKDTPEMQENRSSISSQDTLYEQAVYPLPQRPYSAHTRMESGSSSGSGRPMKPDPNRPVTGVSTRDTRMSFQSIGSASTVHGVQEPKPYV